MHDVPLIDLQPQFDNPAAEAEIAEQISHACESSGFFAVHRHGIPKKIIEDCWQASHEFFSLSEEEKLKVKMPLQDILMVLLQWKQKLFRSPVGNRHRLI